MLDKSIVELQEELDGLGNEQSTLEEDNSLEAPLSVDGDTDQESELDKSGESEEKDDSKDEEVNESPAKVSKEFLKQKAEERQEKRFNRIKALEDKFGNVEAILNKVVGLLEKNQTQEAEDKISSYAEKHGLDANGIKELVGIIKEDLGVEKQPEQKSDKVNYDEAEQKEIFDSEWEELMPIIEQQYPNATLSQIKEAQKLMEEISQSSPQLANYDLEDILNSPKYSQKFKDILFSVKKKTFESGKTNQQGKFDSEIDFDNVKIDSPQDALKIQEAFFKASQGNNATMYDSRTGKETQL